MSEVGFTVHLNLSYGDAIIHVTKALKTEGFGVLTEIDVRSTIKEKLGKNHHPYTILGACNPPLAFKALTNAPEIGLFLPCNITVEESVKGGAIVRILDPKIMIGLGNMDQNKTLVEVAEEASQKLERVAKLLTE
jgi:uncharacterized protein (DUF302 family)